jgi:thiamine transporter
MSKRDELIRTMAEVAVFSALGYVLDLLASFYSKFAFVNGGSIGIALACVFFVAYRRGTFAGIATGLIMGLLQLTGDVYAVGDTWWKVFSQVALDYWLSYPIAGLAGVFKGMFDKAQTKKARVLAVIYGCLLGGFLKYLCHYLSGILFWPGDPWNCGGSYVYSLLYNGAYMLPCIILSGAVMVLFAAKYPAFLSDPSSTLVFAHREENKENQPKQ